MSIVKMKRLGAIVLREQRDALMRELCRLGCVQVQQPQDMLADPDTAALLRPERPDLTAERTRLASLQSAVRVLEQYAPQKKKLLSALPRVSEREFLDDAALNFDLQVAEELNTYDAKLRRLQAEQTRLTAQRLSLEPWAGLDVPLEKAATRTCTLLLMSALAKTDMDAVAAAAASVSEASEIIRVSDDDKQHCFAVVTMNQDVPAMTDALVHTMGCAPVSFPDLSGTPAECIAAADAQLADIAANRDEIIELIRANANAAPALRLSADRMSAYAAQAEATAKLSGTDNIVALEGWCPEADTDRVIAALEQFDCAYSLRDPTPQEYPSVPTKLKNRSLFTPMNMVTEMYSLPAYDGVDPNPLMWPFFVLFYGIMMADMGYGLLMILASIVAAKKMRPRGGTGYLVSLLMAGGITTFVFGALTGSFFGDFLPQLVGLINPDTTFTALPSLFTPLNDTVMILIGSLALGVVQIFTGMTINVIEKCRRHEGLSALFNEGAWWFLLFGVAALFLSKTAAVVLLCIGGVLLIVGQFWEKRSFIGGFTGLFGAIYNGVTGYFGDILSYSRLMALMLAGNVIATVFNTLGALTGNVVLFIVIAAIGNALNFALNLLSCFVHDLRLQVLEFFNRFYKDGGKPFKPLAANTKYVDIIKEEM